MCARVDERGNRPRKKINNKLVKEKSLGIACHNVYVEVKQSILNVSSTVNALARLEGFNKGDHTIPHVTNVRSLLSWV